MNQNPVNPVIEQWNAAAERFQYDQEQSEFAKVNKAVVRERFPKDRVNGKTVLDLGCGYGYYTNYFHESGAAVIGCDGSAEMLTLAKKNCPDCTFGLADIETHLPYENDRFDLVFCNQVLMDIERFEEALSEIHRVTKPSGTFYMSIVHPAFYDCEWGKDEHGFRKTKIMERYLTEYFFDNEYWGKTRHYHRTVSFYVNRIIEKGFRLIHMEEPESYDGVRKSKEFPLFLFMEFVKQ